MHARSARNKGNRFENYLVKRLQEIDVNAKRNYASGSGLDPGDIRMPLYDFNVEAKNAKTISLVKDFQQTQQQAKESGGTPVLMIRNPRLSEFQQTFVVMDMEDWLDIIGGKTIYEAEDVMTKDTKWKLKKLKDAVHEVMKIIDKSK